MKKRTSLLILPFLLSMAALATLIVSCARSGSPGGQAASSSSARIAARIGAYVGSQQCAPCHRKEFDSQSHTHHALSLQFAATPAVAAAAPPEGPIGKTGFGIHRENGAVFFDVPAGSGLELNSSGSGSVPLKFITGSGKGFISYITPVSDSRVLVIRQSYFPRRRRWYVTPRMDSVHGAEPGLVISGVDAQTCVGCHSVNAASVGVDPTKEEMGVGCESCHGPGGAHVEAMNLKQMSDLHIEIHRGKTAQQIVDVCAQCHHVEPQPGDVGLKMRRAGKATSFGLARTFAQSKCYQEGRSGLTCTTCHDPHANISEENAYYNDKCLSCHAGKDTTSSPQTATSFPQTAATFPQTAATFPQTMARRACPVKPDGDCVSCHMPRYYVTPDKILPRLLTDHRIAVYRQPPK